MENVAVMGASSNPERYSFKAVKLLEEYGHKVFPVHPSKHPIDGTTCYGCLEEIGEKIDTITLYLGPRNSTPLIDEIISTRPGRIIMNPGAENDELKQRCEQAGIEVQEACTLVLLKTNQF